MAIFRRKSRLAGGVLLVMAALMAARADESSNIAQANQTLQLAGYPSLPADVEKIKCYAWSGQSAGIYAGMTFKDAATLAGWLKQLPPGLDRASPVPSNLISPPLAEASWFSPATTGNAYVLYRGRIWHAAPEMFRVYVEEKKLTLFLYYSWNNKRTYP